MRPVASLNLHPFQTPPTMVAIALCYGRMNLVTKKAASGWDVSLVDLKAGLEANTEVPGNSDLGDCKRISACAWLLGEGISISIFYLFLMLFLGAHVVKVR